MDFINEYFPAPDELPADTRVDARDRIVAWFATYHPNIDTRPNSVAGDNLVTPLGEFLACLEEAARRYNSDLNPGNVERGVVYSCDIARAFMANFGVDQQTFLPSRGFVRLVFSTPTTRLIDRSIQFSFGADQVFSPQMFSDRRTITLSEVPSADGDRYLYRAVAEGWEVLLPLVGTASSNPPTAGTQPAISETLANLVRAEAATDFFAGDTAPTLAQQAARIRQTLAPQTLETRLGTVSTLLRRFSEISTVGVVSAVDDTYLLEPGQVGVHVRGRQPYVEVREIVGLKYSAGTDRFYGVWSPAAAPVRIRQLVHSAYTFDADDAAVNIYAQATGDYPLFLSGFSGEETFSIGVPMPRSGGAAVIIPTPVGSDLIGYFEVVYWTDPTADTVRRFLSSRANRPINPTYVRPLIPFICSEVEVGFIRQAGVELALQAAREDIAEYLNSLGGDRRFSLAKISALMRNSGAFELTRVRITAKAIFSAAKAHVPVGVDMTNPTAVAAAAVLPISVELVGEDSYEDVGTFADPAKFCAIGPENRGLIVEQSSVVFKESRA